MNPVARLPVRLAVERLSAWRDRLTRLSPAGEGEAVELDGVTLEAIGCMI